MVENCLKDICKIFHFKDLGDERGNLVVIESGMDIPFELKRVFIFMVQIVMWYVANMQTVEQNLY